MKIPKFIKGTVTNLVKRQIQKDLDGFEQIALKNLSTAQDARRFENQFPTHIPIWNAIQYCAIAHLDLTVLLNELLMAKTDWRRKLFARILASTLFECVDDMPAILARDFRSSITSIADKHEVWDGIELVRKELADFGKKHKVVLEEIRHITFAHRDQRADLQFEVIKKLNVNLVYELSIKFNCILREFENLTFIVLSEFNKRNHQK